MARPRLTPGAAQGVSSLARPWPQGGPRFPQDDGTLDLAPGTVTGPGGHTVPRVLGTDAQFPARACEGCPQRAPGTTARSGPGRSRPIRADAPCQPTRRAKITTQRGRASRRTRTAVEQAIAQHSAHQGRRAREKGRRTNQCDGRRHAAVRNLQVAAHSVEALQLAA